MSLQPPPRCDAPLAGMCVGLLRFAGARSPVARALTNAGAQVLVLPTLSLRAPPDPELVRAELQALADAEAWIFVSPASVRFIWQACPDFAPHRDARVFAVGPGTAAALSRHAVASIYPPQHHDSEGVLAMPELGGVRGTVALVKAPGGRALLSDELRARAFKVREVAAYRRVPARWDSRHRARLNALLQAYPRALLLATSAEALTALTDLAGQSLDAVLRVSVLVSSARLAAHAKALGFRDTQIAASTAPAALLAAAHEAVRSVARIAHGGNRTPSR